MRVALLHWLADNAPAPRELQIWRHAPTGAYYLILWQGALGAAAGPMPLAEAQAVQQGHAPEPAHWPDLADWADAAWERGEMERVGGGHE